MFSLMLLEGFICLTRRWCITAGKELKSVMFQSWLLRSWLLIHLQTFTKESWCGSVHWFTQIEILMRVLSLYSLWILPFCCCRCDLSKTSPARGSPQRAVSYPGGLAGEDVSRMIGRWSGSLLSDYEFSLMSFTKLLDHFAFLSSSFPLYLSKNLAWNERSLSKVLDE